MVIVCIASYWAGYGLYDPVSRNQPQGFASKVARTFASLECGLAEYRSGREDYPEDLFGLADACPVLEPIVKNASELNISGKRLSSTSFRLYASWPPVYKDESELPNFRARQTLELFISPGE